MQKRGENYGERDIKIELLQLGASKATKYIIRYLDYYVLFDYLIWMSSLFSLCMYLVDDVLTSPTSIFLSSALLSTENFI